MVQFMKKMEGALFPLSPPILLVCYILMIMGWKLNGLRTSCVLWRMFLRMNADWSLSLSLSLFFFFFFFFFFFVFPLHFVLSYHRPVGPLAKKMTLTVVMKAPLLNNIWDVMFQNGENAEIRYK